MTEKEGDCTATVVRAGDIRREGGNEERWREIKRDYAMGSAVGRKLKIMLGLEYLVLWTAHGRASCYYADGRRLVNEDSRKSLVIIHRYIFVDRVFGSHCQSMPVVTC